MPPDTTKQSVQRGPKRKMFSEAFPPAAPAFVIQKKVQATLASLREMSTKQDRENMPRFGIATTKALGVSVANIRVLAKRLGCNHELAAGLWETGWHEARLMSSFVDDPARVTPEQMDRWCRDFDNWAICDTVCFHLFDRTPHTWTKVAQWRDRPEEFVKRAAFALIASLAGHDKSTGDGPFLEQLAFIESAAIDERNFVKKSVSWALRRVGRRDEALNAAAVEVARRLLASPVAAARWVGKDTIKDLTRANGYATTYPSGPATPHRRPLATASLR